MRVQAIKVAGGFLIPFDAGLRDIPYEKILLDIERIEPPPEEEDYAALDQLAGLYNTGDTTASVEHDQRIYHSRTPS